MRSMDPFQLMTTLGYGAYDESMDPSRYLRKTLMRLIYNQDCEFGLRGEYEKYYQNETLPDPLITKYMICTKGAVISGYYSKLSNNLTYTLIYFQNFCAKKEEKYP